MIYFMTWSIFGPSHLFFKWKLYLQPIQLNFTDMGSHSTMRESGLGCTCLYLSICFFTQHIKLTNCNPDFDILEYEKNGYTFQNSF